MGSAWYCFVWPGGMQAKMGMLICFFIRPATELLTLALNCRRCFHCCLIRVQTGRGRGLDPLTVSQAGALKSLPLGVAVVAIVAVVFVFSTFVPKRRHAHAFNALLNALACRISRGRLWSGPSTGADDLAIPGGEGDRALAHRVDRACSCRISRA